MRLLCDEAVDRPIVEALRADGHDVLYVAEMEPGIDDEQVLARANELRALLVTLDKDFGELVFRQRRLTAGVLLIRLAGMPSGEKQQATVAALREHGEEMKGSFTVVAPNKIRIRRPHLP